jgi:large subunit ribosomal protein L28
MVFIPDAGDKEYGGILRYFGGPGKIGFLSSKSIVKSFDKKPLNLNLLSGNFGVYQKIQLIIRIMARKDDITGKKPLNGYRSSKANNKTKHRFHLNLQKRRFYIPEEDRWVTLKVTAKTLRTINKKGISAVLKEARKKGTLLKEV